MSYAQDHIDLLRQIEKYSPAPWQYRFDDGASWELWKLSKSAHLPVSSKKHKTVGCNYGVLGATLPAGTRKCAPQDLMMGAEPSDAIVQFLNPKPELEKSLVEGLHTAEMYKPHKTGAEVELTPITVQWPRHAERPSVAQLVQFFESYDLPVATKKRPGSTITGDQGTPLLQAVQHGLATPHQKQSLFCYDNRLVGVAGMVSLALSLRPRITPTLAPVYMAGSGLVLVVVGLHAVDHHVADRAMGPKLILSIRHLDHTYRHIASQQTGTLDVAATRTSWLSPSYMTNKTSKFIEQWGANMPSQN